MRKIYLKLISLMIMFGLVACGGGAIIVSPDLDKDFVKKIMIEDVNESLILKNITNDDEINYGDDVRLLVENVSQYPILITDNPAPLSIFTIDKNEWQGLVNNISFVSSSGKGWSTLSPKGKEQINYLILPANPMLPSNLDMTNDRIVRFLIIGKTILDDDKLGVAVGGYVDVEMHP